MPTVPYIFVAVLSALIALAVVKRAWRPYLVPALSAVAGALGAWLLARSMTPDNPPRESPQEPRTRPPSPTPPPLPLPVREDPVWEDLDLGTEEMDLSELRDFLRRSEAATSRHEEDP